MLDFAGFQLLTFDCYGTLIDWEQGILGALRPLLAAKGKLLRDEEILETYAQLEAQAERGEYRPYREILQSVVLGLGLRWGFKVSPAEAESLPNSLAEWPPFPDTVGALRRLKSRYQLAILSNTDDDLFALTAKRLEVPFDHVITAQQARSYKPSPNNFQTMLARVNLPREKILHVAQSLFHDVAPARSLGLTTVWVNRRALKPGPGATPPADARPDFEVPDLGSLAEAVERHFLSLPSAGKH